MCTFFKIPFSTSPSSPLNGHAIVHISEVEQRRRSLFTSAFRLGIQHSSSRQLSQKQNITSLPSIYLLMSRPNTWWTVCIQLLFYPAYMGTLIPAGEICTYEFTACILPSCLELCCHTGKTKKGRCFRFFLLLFFLFPLSFSWSFATFCTLIWSCKEEQEGVRGGGSCWEDVVARLWGTLNSTMCTESKKLSKDNENTLV